MKEQRSAARLFRAEGAADHRILGTGRRIYSKVEARTKPYEQIVLQYRSLVRLQWEGLSWVCRPSFQSLFT